MNKTANATEIKFKEPITRVVIPIVTNSPNKIVESKIKIGNSFLKRIHKITPTKIKLNIPEIIAPFETDVISSKSIIKPPV